MTVPSYLAFTVISVLSLALAVSSLTLAQDPTREPPLDNVSPPLNTSSSSQVKAGGLSVGSLIVGAGEESLVIDSSFPRKDRRPTLRFPRIDIYTDGNGNTYSESASLSREKFELKSWVRSSVVGQLRIHSLTLFPGNIILERINQQYNNASKARYSDSGVLLEKWSDSSREGQPSNRASLDTSGLEFLSIREQPKDITSNTRDFNIRVRNSTTNLAERHLVILGIRREPSSYSSRFYMTSERADLEQTSRNINNYKARLGINTENPRYPLDVVVSSTTTEPWVAGFGRNSLVKIAADGRVAANQYCDSEGNNCLTPGDSSSSLPTPPNCVGENRLLGWDGSGWVCNNLDLPSSSLVPDCPSDSWYAIAYYMEWFGIGV